MFLLNTLNNFFLYLYFILQLAARTMKSLPNVNGNITKIRRFHILNELENRAAKKLD